MSTAPAIEVQMLLLDERWPTYRADLQERHDALQTRLVTGHLDHAQMCRLAGEIRSLRYALGLPDELRTHDPRSTA